MAAAATTPLLPEPPQIVKSDYAGFGPTIKKVAAYIRECGDDPEFQKFANTILDSCFPRSQHTTVLDRAQCLLDYTNKNVRFAPDPPGTELVKSPRVTLCVPGGTMCIPIEDCDGHCAAYLALCRAAGIDVRMLLQKLPKSATGEYEYHLAGVIRLDDGEHVRVDPSLKGASKVGQYQPAISEQVIDPLDPDVTGDAGGAKFITIGATPRIFFVADRPTGLRLMPPAIGGCGPCEAAAAERKKLEEQVGARRPRGPMLRAMVNADGTIGAYLPGLRGGYSPSFPSPGHYSPAYPAHPVPGSPGYVYQGTQVSREYPVCPTGTVRDTVTAACVAPCWDGSAPANGTCKQLTLAAAAAALVAAIAANPNYCTGSQGVLVRTFKNVYDLSKTGTKTSPLPNDATYDAATAAALQSVIGGNAPPACM